MMKLACKDLDSTTTCNFEATGASASEVAGKMMGHIKSDHPEKMEGMSGADMMSMLESKVHD